MCPELPPSLIESSEIKSGSWWPIKLRSYQNMVSSFIGWLTYRLPFSLSGLASRIPLNVLRNHHQKLAGLNLALSLPEIIALFNYVNMTPCCFYNISCRILILWYPSHSLPLTVKLEDRLPKRWLCWMYQVNGEFISTCRSLYTDIWMKLIKYYMTWCNDRYQDFADLMGESGLLKSCHVLSCAL